MLLPDDLVPDWSFIVTFSLSSLLLLCVFPLPKLSLHIFRVNKS